MLEPANEDDLLESSTDKLIELLSPTSSFTTRPDSPSVLNGVNYSISDSQESLRGVDLSESCEKMISTSNSKEYNMETEDQEQVVVSARRSRWFFKSWHDFFLRISSPRFMLVFMTVCNFLNYVDRGAIAGCMPAIADDFDLNGKQQGVVGAAFMLGYMIMAPIFGHLSRKYRPAVLMSIGLLAWTIAAFGTGISIDFYTLTVVRTLIGVGEASFAGLAPTYIDDVAPPSSRSLWLALFFSTIPIGAAVGYCISGVFAALGLWWLTFILEAIVMGPYAVACYFAPDPEDVVRKSGREPTNVVTDSELEKISFLQSIYELSSNLRYDLIVFGYAAICFVTGALYFWAPSYVVHVLHIPIGEANVGIGLITVICGLVGTAFGGWLVDFMGGGDVIATAVVVGFSSVFLPLVLASFIVDSTIIFFVLVTIAEFLLFGITAPINMLCLSVVEPQHKSFGITIEILIIHLLGDFPSPFIIGAISDRYSMRTAMIFCSAWTLYAIFFFGLMYFPVREHARQTKAEIVQESNETEEEAAEEHSKPL